MVMQMKSSKEMLSSILKTAQLGQLEIKSVLDTSMRPGLRKALEGQLKEYDSIESDAHSIASQRGWELQEPEPAQQYLRKMKTRVSLSHGNADSKIASMIIRGNTQGMIQGLKDVHQFNLPDDPIHALSQKLLDCETANIRQMQPFL